jgi:glycosyltransferase involved in cell wall biosynthesis
VGNLTVNEPLRALCLCAFVLRSSQMQQQIGYLVSPKPPYLRAIMARSLRIAVNARFWQPNRMEGMGRHLYHVLKELVAQRPNDTFLLLFDRKPDFDWRLGLNIEMQVVFPPARHPLLFYIWYELAVPKVLKRWQADVFWSPDNFGSLRSPCPVLLTVHDLAYKHFPEHITPDQLRYLSRNMPRFIQSAQRVIAVSAFTRADILGQVDYPAEKVLLTNNAASEGIKPMNEAEIAQFRLENTGGRPYFVYCGAIHPRKNIAKLIEAYMQYRSLTQTQPMPLVLVGRMAWRTDTIKKQIETIPDIIWTDYQPDEQRNRWLAAATALVYISLFEGFGMPVLEGMQAGVPIICSRESAMSEVAGDKAMLVDPQNALEIAQAMFLIQKDLVLQSQLRLAGIERAKSYTWVEAAKVYNECLDLLGA